MEEVKALTQFFYEELCGTYLRPIFDLYQSIKNSEEASMTKRLKEKATEEIELESPIIEELNMYDVSRVSEEGVWLSVSLVFKDFYDVVFLKPIRYADLIQNLAFEVFLPKEGEFLFTEDSGDEIVPSFLLEYKEKHQEMNQTRYINVINQAGGFFSFSLDGNIVSSQQGFLRQRLWNEFYDKHEKIRPASLVKEFPDNEGGSPQDFEDGYLEESLRECLRFYSLFAESVLNQEELDRFDLFFNSLRKEDQVVIDRAMQNIKTESEYNQWMKSILFLQKSGVVLNGTFESFYGGFRVSEQGDLEVLYYRYRDSIDTSPDTLLPDFYRWDINWGRKSGFSEFKTDEFEKKYSDYVLEAQEDGSLWIKSSTADMGVLLNKRGSRFLSVFGLGKKDFEPFVESLKEDLTNGFCWKNGLT